MSETKNSRPGRTRDVALWIAECYIDGIHFRLLCAAPTAYLARIKMKQNCEDRTFRDKSFVGAPSIPKLFNSPSQMWVWGGELDNEGHRRFLQAKTISELIEFAWLTPVSSTAFIATSDARVVNMF